MFRFAMVCAALLTTPALAKDYRPDRQVVVQSSCSAPWVTRYGVKSCIMIGEHIRQGGDPGLRGGIKWDGRPSLLMSGTSKDFALVYYLSDVTKDQWTNGEITVWDGDHYINTAISDGHPGVIFRITHDGGKSWSKFYTPYPDRVGSNYLSR